MRWVCLVFLILLMVIDILPIPIVGLLLIWIILFRPAWFYKLVLKIYNKD